MWGSHQVNNDVSMSLKSGEVVPTVDVDLPHLFQLNEWACGGPNLVLLSPHRASIHHQHCCGTEFSWEKPHVGPQRQTHNQVATLISTRRAPNRPVEAMNI